jgi:matrixin
MSSRKSQAWLRRLVWCAAVALVAWAPAREARASLRAMSTAVLSRTRTVEGRVVRLDPRIDALGYPVTDVTLDTGERFTILGGKKNGLRWVVDEEASFVVGQRVRVRLEDGPDGPRTAGGKEAVTPLVDLGAPTNSPLAVVSTIAEVDSVTPDSGPAAADDNLEVDVRGQRFGAEQGPSGIYFQGLFVHVPATVLSWSDTLIQCLVPKPGLQGDPQVLSGSVKVWTPVGGWSDGSEFDGGGDYHVLFQYAGDSWSEASLPIHYYLNPSGFPWPADEVVDLVKSAAQIWNNAPNTYGRFDYVGFTSHLAGRDKDSTNTVGWTSPWPHSASWLAVTWSGIDSVSGERHEVDVEINGDEVWSISTPPQPGTFDLHTTMRHEFGHWIRLGHVQEPGYLMLAYQNQEEMRRSLAEGERQGASWVYPTFGSARASSDTVLVTDGDSDPFTIDVAIADRRGRPVVSMSPGDLYAKAEWLSDPHATTTVPAGIYYPSSPTDGQGRAQFQIPSVHGHGLLRFTVVGGVTSVRNRPIVNLYDPTALPAGSWIVGAPAPNPASSGKVESVLRLGSPALRFTARVLDARGRLVSVLRDGPASAGEQRVTWNLQGAGRRVDTGLYFLDLQADQNRAIRKIVVVGP